MSAERGFFQNSMEEKSFKHKFDVMLGVKKESPLIDQARLNCILSQSIMSTIEAPLILEKFAQDYLQFDARAKEFSDHFIDLRKDIWLPSEVVSDNVIQGYSLYWENRRRSVMRDGEFKTLKYRLSIATTDAKRFGIGIQEGVDVSELTNRELYDYLQKHESGSVIINSSPAYKDPASEDSCFNMRIPLINEHGEFMKNTTLIQDLSTYTQYRLFQYYMQNYCSRDLQNSMPA